MSFNIILIALTPQCCVLSREAANTNIMVIGLTQLYKGEARENPKVHKDEKLDLIVLHVDVKSTIFKI